MSGAAFLLQRRPGRVEPSPSILLAVDPATAALVQGGSAVDLTVTLTRNNFVEDVALAVTNLPTNVTASYPDGQSFTSGETTRRVRLTPGAEAQVVTGRSVTITGSATGVTNATTTASVTVTAAVPETIAIDVTPTSASVTPGNTVDYTVTLTRGGGYTGTVTIATTGLPSGVTASYPSGDTFSGGTTTRTLRLSAASDAGEVSNDSFTVTASGSGVSNATDTATVSVVAASEWAPNLPASGFTLWRDTDFTGGLPTNGSFNADGMAVNPASSAFINATDASAPYGPDCQQWFYEPGTLGGGVGTYGDQLFGSSSYSGKRFYACFTVYFSPNYEVHTNTATEKFIYPPTTNASTSVGIFRVSNGNTQIGLGVIPQTDGGPGTATQSAGPYMTRGTWHTVEIMLTMNTPGNNDGVLQYWLDGVLAWTRSDLKFVTGSTDGNFVGNRTLDSTRGGNNSTVAVPAGGMFRRCSRIAVYTSSTRS